MLMQSRIVSWSNSKEKPKPRVEKHMLVKLTDVYYLLGMFKGRINDGHDSETLAKLLLEAESMVPVSGSDECCNWERPHTRALHESLCKRSESRGCGRT